MMNAILPVFDGHNGTLLNIYRASRDNTFSFFTENQTGHLDLPRDKRGGLSGRIFAIYTPVPEGSPERVDGWEMEITPTGYRQKLHSPLDPEYARTFSDAVIETAFRLERKSGGALKWVRAYADVEDCIARETLALVLHFEGAASVREDLSNLERQ